MYRVLAAVDESDQRLATQLDALGALPGRDDLSVTVLHVHEEIEVAADEAGAAMIESINEDIDDLQGVPDTVSRAVAHLDDLGIESTVTTVRGDPAAAILEVAEEVAADAILVSARQRSPVGKAVFGSVTQSVVLDADRPVLVAK
ncbi:universal stress protein [Halorussus halobius]|uniref:universal stress protein n=1 Tax=Halorussus halobius TaxID=1710537 RepID=UPI001093065B|nr:universal stress protein [Halorussus halobius]